MNENTIDVQNGHTSVYMCTCGISGHTTRTRIVPRLRVRLKLQNGLQQVQVNHAINRETKETL